MTPSKFLWNAMLFVKAGRKAKKDAITIFREIQAYADKRNVDVLVGVHWHPTDKDEPPMFGITVRGHDKAVYMPLDEQEAFALEGILEVFGEMENNEAGEAVDAGASPASD